MGLLERFENGDQVALARIISRVENRRTGYQDILARLYAHAGRAQRIGLTGPPGAGKSSLVFRLGELLSASGKKVGIIAVDPTSPFTGGALLGDRIRMQDLSLDPNIFIRSMATRGSTGGLAEATRDTTMVMDAFGFDLVLIETVGVGQVELDIARACDSVVVVFVPESGDAVQAMKAGLMEIADIYCLNKADRDGAERLVLELQSVLGLRQRTNNWEYPIIQTQAINNIGIDDLWQAIKNHREFCQSDTSPEDRQKERIANDLLTIVRGKVDRRLRSVLRDSETFEKVVADILAGSTNPYSAAERLVAELSTALTS